MALFVKRFYIAASILVLALISLSACQSTNEVNAIRPASIHIISSLVSDRNRLLNSFNPGDEYFWVMIGIGGLTLIQLAIIILLVVNYRRRIQVEKDLRSASDGLRRISYSVPDIIWSSILSPLGEIRSLYLSPAVERVTGFLPEFFEKDPSRWIQQILPVDVSQFTSSFERFRRTGQKQCDDEFRFICQDGRQIWLRSRMTFTLQADGSIRMDGILSDITDRRKALLRLTLQYSVGRTLDYSSGGGGNGIDQIGLIMPEVCNALNWDASVLWKINPDSSYLALTDLTTGKGLNRKEISDHLHSLYLNPKDLLSQNRPSNQRVLWFTSEKMKGYCQICSALEPFGLEGKAALLLSVRGSIQALLTFYTRPDQDNDPGIQEFLDSLASQICINLDARASAEELRKNEAYNRALIEAIPDLLLVLNRQGIFQDIRTHNPSLLYLPREKIIGQSIYAVMPQDIAAMIMDHGERLLITGELQAFEYSLTNPITGTIGHFEARMSMSGMENYILLTRDVSERKQAEIALAKRADEFTTLFNTAREVSLQRDLAQLLNKVIDQTIRILGVMGASIYLYQPEKHSLRLVSGQKTPIPVGTTLDIGEGLAGKVAQSLQPLLIDQYEEWEGRYPHTQISLGPIVGIPIQYGGELIGVLVAYEPGGSTRVFTQVDVNLLTLFGSQVGAAVHNARLFEEKRRRLDQLQSLRAIDQSITSSFDLKLIFKVVLDQVVQTPHIDAADILLYKSDTNTLEYIAGKGFTTSAIEQSRLKPGQGHAGRALQEGRMICISMLPGESDDFTIIPLLAGEKFISYYAFPLFTRGQIKGVLEIFSREAIDENQDWISFMEAIAGQTAVAIDNSRLLDGLQISNRELTLAYDATLEGWARALELRDYETKGHTERVSDLTVMLGKRMGLAENELIDLRRGALLHDVGKIGIPDSILLKPGKLTPEEWEIMRRHPSYALDMLVDIPYLKPSLEIPYYHHERWNGSGYPCGLTAENIPFSARLFAVVDAWDALISERPYRKAWPPEKAIEYLRNQAGIEFDPRIVDVYLSMLEKEMPFILLPPKEDSHE